MARKKNLKEFLTFIGGTPRQIGERFGVSRQAVRMWLVRGKIPYARAVELERLTEGRVRIEDLKELIS